MNDPIKSDETPRTDSIHSETLKMPAGMACDTLVRFAATLERELIILQQQIKGLLK